ncbi:MAG TPA: secretin N-terminal domain-containing protein [Gammaproteobacteria bacterium]|nr:secretin N-terminal domain-containing protein [Gammaproteobacteria bacterium]
MKVFNAVNRAVLTPAAKWFFVLTLCACASTQSRIDGYVAQEEWMQAVVAARKAYSEHPADPGAKSRMQQIELKAADYYYQKGLRMLQQGNIDGAIEQYQQGLTAMPEHSKLTSAMTTALARKEADTYYAEGRRDLQAGQVSDAIKSYQKALDIYPEHETAAKELETLLASREQGLSDKLALKSSRPISLNFRRTDIRTAFEFLAESFGINIIFDDSVKSVPVTLFAKDVTFQQAINLMMTTTKTFYQQIGRNTILIAPDTKEKRGQYEDQIIRVFHLKNIRSKEMAEVIKALVTPKKMVPNEELNTLLIRDTGEILSLVERIIEINDRKPAEVILDVEILEVNRNKAEQIGLDFGSSITAQFDKTTGKVDIHQAFETGSITVSPVTFRYFKQDVDAKTLANPKIRVISEKEAKIHIGDRVPLRQSTIQDATGQTRTTFQYTDIGIKLDVQPVVHYDNSATVNLKLEVSSLGQNLGTQNEPAYSIGTRNAETYMLLRDGETAILGGLIRDEERKNRVKLPGLGDIPVIGALFTSFDDSKNRTDVLLTITPRVVRPWDLPQKSRQSFYSGTDTLYTNEPIFASLETEGALRGGSAAALAGDALAEDSSDAEPQPAVAAGVAAPPPESAAINAQLGFAKTEYEAPAGQEIQLELMAEKLNGIGEMPLQLLFNPQLLGFVSGEAGELALDGFEARPETGKGLIGLTVKSKSGLTTDAPVVFARLRMKGIKPGISYIVYKAPALRTVDGETANAQVKAARVVIK